MSSEYNEPGIRPLHPRQLLPSEIYHIFRILLGLIFVVASLDKIESPIAFSLAIYAYKIMVGPLAYLINPMAIILPWAEIVCGVLLIFNRFVRPASLIIFIMNLMFIFAISSAIVRGIDVECGCGLDIGPMARIAGTQANAEALVRDFVILAMNIVVLFSPMSATLKSTKWGKPRG